MRKLSNLKVGLGSLPPRMGYAPGDERQRFRQRDAVKPWRRWYKTARWQRLRLAVFYRDGYACQMPGCGRLEPNTSLLVADHKRPHRGIEALFWDEANVQTLCKSCHDSKKQALERQADRQASQNGSATYNTAPGGRSKV